MNTARAFGPAVVSGFDQYVPYFPHCHSSEFSSIASLGLSGCIGLDPSLAVLLPPFFTGS